MASRTPLKNRPETRSGHFNIISSTFSTILLLNFKLQGPIRSLAGRNKSISIESSATSKQNSVKKSKSSLSLRIKDKLPNIPKPQDLPQRTLPRKSATMSQSSSLLLDYIKECKYNKSPNDSLEYGDNLFGDYKVPQEEAPTAKLVFRSSLTSYSEIKTSSQNNFDGEGLGLRTPFRDHIIEVM